MYAINIGMTKIKIYEFKMYIVNPVICNGI